MRKRNYIIVGSLCALVAGCGEPMTRTQVIQKYQDHTVTKLTSENSYKHMGSNNPSLGQRNIFHSSDGRAYYFKATDKGYRRSEAGKWWAGEDKICYSMRVTRAEDPEGDQCAPAGTDAAWSTFERGDTKNLRPKRTASRSSGNSGIGLSTGRLLTGVAIAVTGAAVVGSLANKACGPGGCPTASSGAPGAGSASKAKTAAPASRASASAATGYRITQTYTYGPGQDVVARGVCNKGGASWPVKYHPNNSKKYYIYTRGGSSIADVASRFCS